RDIWNAFHLPGNPPDAVGVYENEPSPFSANITAVWLGFAACAIALVAMMIGFDLSAANQPVFTSNYRLSQGEPSGEASFVTNAFELGGRTSNVEITTSASLQNSWIYLNY